ncbi:outer membrane protein assembly factor BamB family protein [Microbulbifer sp. SSSA005]|uniref:outer membrane protein assembly factor BamB family protein n=1 Tax=unclassified Microbulbifer TaxID=2619833 RepID=UPI00403A5C8A
MDRINKIKLCVCIVLLLFSFDLHAHSTWRYKMPGPVAGAPLVLDDQIIATGGSLVVGLNKEGKLLWQWNLGSTTAASAATDGEYLFINADNGLHALSLDGEPLWYFKSEDNENLIDGRPMGWGKIFVPDSWSFYRSSPIVAGGKVYFGNQRGTFALDAKTGKQLWHLSTGVTHTTPAIYKGMLVVGSWNNKLYGIDIISGSIIWTFKGKQPYGQVIYEGFNQSPVIYDGTVYIGNRDTYFYAVDAETGKQKWSYKHPTSWIGSPAIEEDGELYFGMSDGLTLIRLNAKNGNQSMNFNANFFIFAKPQMTDTQVFVATMAGQVFAVDKKSSKGQLLFSTPDCLKKCESLIKPSGGMKYINDTSADGMARNVEFMVDMADSLLSMTYSDNTLYLGSAKGHIYALNPHIEITH